MCLRCLLELWETHSALYIFYSLDRIFFQHRNLLSTPNSLLSLDSHCLAELVCEMGFIFAAPLMSKECVAVSIALLN